VEREQEKRLRDRFQRERPTINELMATGDYSEPTPQGEILQQMRLASRLKELRTTAEVSLTELSSRTGMDKAALSRLENGIADNPTLSTLERYLRALGKRLRIEIDDALGAN
jgi:DNA-binding Xre family transcriptional regulator